jgi:outer membrane protein OmpA-like peptidoglycan-associated protein
MMNWRFSQILVLASLGILLSSCASMYLKQGTEAHANLKYATAIEKLEKGLKSKPDAEKRLLLADAYVQTNQYEKAVGAYENAMTSKDITDEDRLNYGRALMSTGNYTKAENIFEGILSRDDNNVVAEKLKQSCERIAEMKKDSTLYNVDQLMIPGLVTFYSPVHYNDGLLISGQQSGGKEKDPYNELAYLDIYYTKLEGGQWSSPKAVEGVNEVFHDALPSVSEDGNTMILTRSDYNPDGKLAATSENFNNPQLYSTQKNAEGNWEEPKPLPFNDKNSIVAHPALNHSGDTLYFASNMDGTVGKMDIFMSVMLDGEWSTPSNLTNKINTPGNEVFPTLKGSDTLYFASNAQQSLGGLDILYSVKKNGEWSAPMHMDYPINSSYDDFGIVFNKGGDSGYLSSNRDKQDRIYSFQIFNPEIYVEGLVNDKESMMPLKNATIIIENLTDGTKDTLTTDDEGKFKLELKQGKDYKITAQKDEYFNVSTEVSTKDITTDSDLQVVLEMEELIVSDPDEGDDDATADNEDDGDGETDSGDDDQGDDDKTDGDDKSTALENYPYVVPNIYWDFDRAVVREDAKPYLNQLVKKLKDNPGLRIEIRSHCDCRGTMEYNDNLSQRRASAVVRYLIAKGIDRSRLLSEGKGERELKNDCDCSEGRYACSEKKHQENRRTEFIVLEK